MNKIALRDLKSVYLIVGTAIGTGILALPISTSQSGFFFSSISLTLCWFFMTIAAFFMMESRLYFKEECDLDFMSEQTVGRRMEIFTKISYLLLLFCLVAAYILVGSSWLIEFGETFLNFSFNKMFSMIIFTVASAFLIVQGVAIVGKTNHVITVILLISFGLIILFSLNYVTFDNLTESGEIKEMAPTIPLILTSFGFSIVIPTLASYQENNAKRIGESVIIGSIIILFAYIIWQLVCFGVIGRSGEHGLLSFLNSTDKGTEIVLSLQHIVKSPFLTHTARIFIIFAVISSLLGVGLSLYHFMLDAIKIKQNELKVPAAVLSTFIPPLGILIFYPTGIVQILTFAGIFVAVILGIVPCMMVWHGRYIKNIKSDYRMSGGKPLILITGAFFIYVIIQELYNLF